MNESIYTLDDLQVIPSAEELALMGTSPPRPLEVWTRHRAENGASDVYVALDRLLGRILLVAVMEAWVRLGEPPTRTEVARLLRGKRAVRGLGPPAETEGLLGRMSATDLRDALDRLVAVGLLAYAQRGRHLVPTPAGLEVIRAPARGPAPGVVRALLGARLENGLTKALKAYRREKAQELSVAPYRILTDRVVSALALAQPRSLQELASVSAIGPVTLANYGEDIVRVIAAA